MRTIVQEYGPIYGEPVNGTVMGRPNGSVFVPSTNTITNVFTDDVLYFVYNGGNLNNTTSDGTGTTPVNAMRSVAVAQDLASYIHVAIYSDAELTNVVAYRTYNSADFNLTLRWIYNADVTGLSNGDPLYLVSYLMNNGVIVATSETVEAEYLVP